MTDEQKNSIPSDGIPLPLPRVKVRPTPTAGASSPRFTVSTPLTTTSGKDTPTSGAARKIAIAVDLSDESEFAVKWTVDQYLRPGDAVILLHVRPTSVLYGADWGCVDSLTASTDGGESQQKLEDDFDAFTTSKVADLAQPLIDAQVPYKIHIVKDHDMKERLCLEVERMGFNAVVMGSRGFGASKRGSSGRLGSVSDYCVRHCVCPVVVVRYPDEKDAQASDDVLVTLPETDREGVAEEEEYHDADADADDERKATA